MRNIDKIILHCSATPEGRYVTASDIKKWHLDRGFSDIGYHFIVYLDGSIVTGRPIEKPGAHVKGMNAHSVGVCYIGGCDKDLNPKDTRTSEQIKALDMLLSDLMNEYPEASLHGHNEFSAKACPSFKVDQEYSYIIDCYGRQ